MTLGGAAVLVPEPAFCAIPTSPGYSDCARHRQHHRLDTDRCAILREATTSATKGGRRLALAAIEIGESALWIMMADDTVGQPKSSNCGRSAPASEVYQSSSAAVEAVALFELSRMHRPLSLSVALSARDCRESQEYLSHAPSGLRDSKCQSARSWSRTFEAAVVRCVHPGVIRAQPSSPSSSRSRPPSR